MATHTLPATAILTDAAKDGQLQWRREKVNIRAPLDDEVLVRVIASGICHTDLAISFFPAGLPGFAPYPKVLGHEGAGIVEQAGNGVTHLEKGDKVLLSFDYCGKEGCRACEDETPGYCAEFHSKNLFAVPEVYKTDNGTAVAGLFFGQSSFASMAIVKGTSALNVSQLIQDEEELKLFAPLGCGYQTGAASVTELANVGEKDSIAIFGLGGVGMAAIMAARVRGAKTIIGVDKVQSRLALAKELGANHTIDTSNFTSPANDLAAAIRKIVPRGTHANFDTTGVVPLIEAGVQSLHPKGQMILIGIVDGKKMELDLGPILAFGTAIRGSIEGNAKPSKFVPQMIKWYRQGKFPIEKLTKFYPAEDFQKALGDMHTGSTIKPVLLW